MKKELRKSCLEHLRQERHCQRRYRVCRLIKHVLMTIKPSLHRLPDETVLRFVDEDIELQKAIDVFETIPTAVKIWRPASVWLRDLNQEGIHPHPGLRALSASGLLHGEAGPVLL